MEKIVHEALKSNPNVYVTKGMYNVYVCVNVCVYVCICVCVCVSVVCVHMYVCVHVSVNMCVRCVCMRMCMCEYMCTCVHECLTFANDIHNKYASISLCSCLDKILRVSQQYAQVRK